jgi:hypothetical protein
MLRVIYYSNKSVTAKPIDLQFNPKVGCNLMYDFYMGSHTEDGDSIHNMLPNSQNNVVKLLYL